MPLNLYNSYVSNHQYTYLPLYSKFLLEHFLEDLVKFQMKTSGEIKLPVLERLAHLDNIQLIETSVSSMKEYLQFLSDGKAKDLVDIFLSRWSTDQLKVIGKTDLVAETVTLLNYMHSKSFRYFIPHFTRDVDVVLELVSELDNFFTGTTTAAFNTYIQMQREQITKQATALLEAQRIAGIGSFEWDLITNKTNSSPETNRIFGLENEGYDEFIHHVHQDDRDKVNEQMARAMLHGFYECEYRFQNLGLFKHIWAKGAINFDSSGKPVMFIGIVQDITKRKKAEQELINQKKALEHSNESLQQFAFIASHHLQEPMRQISTFADMVLSREKNLSEHSAISLKKVVRLAIRLRQMIDDILSYSTLSQLEAREDFELSDILKIVLDNLEQRIEEKSGRIDFQDLPRINAVPSQIQQLIENLISNALKFSRKDVSPIVTISFEICGKEQIDMHNVDDSARYLKLIVQDNGIGFDEQFANKIFGLFSRLNNKKDYNGSGIGLAIAKKIVDNHGGVLTVSSVKGLGSTFTVILPQ